MKRQHVAKVVELPRMVSAERKGKMLANGESIVTKQPSNAFRYPNAMDAEFPQITKQLPIDFRSGYLEGAGYAPSRLRRKK